MGGSNERSRNRRRGNLQGAGGIMESFLTVGNGQNAPSKGSPALLQTGQAHHPFFTGRGRPMVSPAPFDKRACWIIEENSMSQRGYVFEDCGTWYVRYRENVRQPDGSIKRVQTARPIATKLEYPRKRDVMPLVKKFMDEINSTSFSPDAGMSVARFITDMFLPNVERNLKPST